MPQLGVRRTRSQANRLFRLRKPEWVDPYPFIPGTEPEKRIFEACMRRRLYFIFQGDLPELSHQNTKKLKEDLKKLETEIRHLIAQLAKLGNQNQRLERIIKAKFKAAQDLQNKIAELDAINKAGVASAFLFQPGFKPDFIFPEYRVILDPFGVFHHSLPEAVKRDALKSAVYRALGYAFYHPWWDEKGFLWAEGTGSQLVYERIGYDALLLLDRIKELRHGPTKTLTDPLDIAAKKNPGYRLGPNIGAGANSVAIANRLRTKPKLLTIKARRRKTR